MRVLTCVALLGMIAPTPAGAQPAPAPACSDGAVCTRLAVEALQRNDAALSTTYLQRACELGSADGCAGLGKAYQTGRGTAVDPVRAAEAYRAACKGGAMNACHNLALAIGRKEMTGTDAEVVELLTRACDHGVQPSCAELARVKAAPPAPTCGPATPAVCFAACMKRAERGPCDDARRWGRFSEADWAKLDQRRCALEDWSACVEVGWRHERARAVAKAFKHYQLACDRGHVGCAAAARLKACKSRPRTCPKPVLPAELADDDELGGP